MSHDPIARLLPALSKPQAQDFNVFDVMHHGSHEKQLSNVFAWLLDASGTHKLGAMFQQIFVAEVNAGLAESERFPEGGFRVATEANTSAEDEEKDIADLILEHENARIVIENYWSSDGHGHSYEGYLSYSQRDGRQGVVVLLCQAKDESLQMDGWENATVVLYSALLDKLLAGIAADPKYMKSYPDPHSFIVQMHRKFGSGGQKMADDDTLEFVAAMCQTGEAKRYGWTSHEQVAKQFGEDLAKSATTRFGEGRDLLQRVKGRLKTFCANTLLGQLAETFGSDFVGKCSANFQGIYLWTINFDVDDPGDEFGEYRLAIKFGPSAWFANEQDANWKRRVQEPDYARLFVTRARTREIRQSAITLQEVLDGLAATDTRLRDEIADLFRDRVLDR